MNKITDIILKDWEQNLNLTHSFFHTPENSLDLQNTAKHS